MRFLLASRPVPGIRIRNLLQDQEGNNGDATRGGERTPYGQKYITVGLLTGASGRQAEVIVVWIVRRDEDFPRLVTVVPRGDR